MSFNEKNKLSGGKLKKLITNEKLPNEYMNEENLNALLDNVIITFLLLFL